MFGKLIAALRWLGVRLLVAVAVWAVLYTAVNFYLTRERDQAMDWFTANGIPTYPEPFTPPDKGDKDDAGPLWRAAAEVYGTSNVLDLFHKENSDASYVEVTLKDGKLILTIGGNAENRNRPITTEELATVHKYLDAQATVFDLLRQAAARPKYQSPIDFSPGLATQLPNLTPEMNLARLLCVAAEVSVSEGRGDRAIGYWTSLKSMERWTADEPTLISTMCTVAIDGMLCKSVQESLRARPFSEPELKQVSMIVQPRRDYREQFRVGMKGELAWMNIFFRDLLAGRFDLNQFHITDAPPLCKAAGLARLEWLAGQAVFLKSYRQIYEQMKTDFGPNQFSYRPDKSIPWYAFTAQLFIPPIGGFAKSLCKHATEARVTAWGVALRRQKLATGSYPERLADLKPEFTAGLGEPLDPFTDKPLIYHRQGEGFIIYSVGPNLKDDGGHNAEREKPQGAADDITFELKD